MRLYLLTAPGVSGYDTFDSVVVAAESKEAARQTHPYGLDRKYWDFPTDSWARSPDQVEVKFIGTAKRGTKAGPILASFNAG